MFFFGGAYFTLLYYLPIYFQSIHNASPIGSGVRMLALIIPLTIAAIVQGFALTKIDIVPLFWLLGGVLETVGAGLFYTMDANTSAGKWIGYQILVGFMTGWTFQVAIANAQIHAQPEDLSQVTAIVNCKPDLGIPIYKYPSTDYVYSLCHSWRSILRLRGSVCIQQPNDQAARPASPGNRSGNGSCDRCNTNSSRLSSFTGTHRTGRLHGRTESCLRTHDSRLRHFYRGVRLWQLGAARRREVEGSYWWCSLSTHRCFSLCKLQGFVRHIGTQFCLREGVRERRFEGGRWGIMLDTTPTQCDHEIEAWVYSLCA